MYQGQTRTLTLPRIASDCSPTKQHLGQYSPAGVHLRPSSGTDGFFVARPWTNARNVRYYDDRFHGVLALTDTLLISGLTQTAGETLSESRI